jgi:thiamine biosynthesis lipoprotein
MEALRAADRFTDINGIIIDEENGTVFLSHAGMALDVGSIGKGYALERAVQKAIDAGFASFILSVGGDVRAANGPPGGNGNAWRIGVNDPIHPGAIIDTLSVADHAVFTSGDYLRGPHIIDPRTLMPADTVRSATVIHPDGIMAEILSLAVFILDIGTAKELLASHGAEALWVMADGSVVTTEGFGRYR